MPRLKIPTYSVLSRYLALLSVSTLLMLAVCSDEAEVTPTAQAMPTSQVTPTAPPTPTAEATPTPEPQIVDQLRKNAEEFAYAIGNPGGALTFATISEPLTFNLAIANDAS